jgi:hypothetical protein
MLRGALDLQISVKAANRKFQNQTQKKEESSRIERVNLLEQQEAAMAAIQKQRDQRMNRRILLKQAEI